jgi:VWFA-related protein
MLRSLLVMLIAGPTALSPAAGQAPDPSPSPGVVFPAGVEQVTVDALVLDEHGQPVEGLRREDFTVKEEGRVQPISSFEAISLPESASAPAVRTTVSTNARPPAVSRSFVIVFDDVNLTLTSEAAAQRSIRRFLETGVRAGDVVTILPTSGGAWWTERMPEGEPELRAFLGHLEARYRPDTSSARLSDFEAVQLHYRRDPTILSQVLRRYYENGVIQEFQEPKSAAQLDTSPGTLMVRARADAVYQSYVARMKLTLGSLARVAAALRQARGRKTVLFVSEGFVHDPSQSGFREVVRTAREANAAFYFVDARGALGAGGAVEVPGAAADQSRLALEQDTLSTLANPRQESSGAESVALDTGGFSIRNTDDLAGRMRAISAESRAFYLLGYVPTDSRRDGKFRKIEVAVGRPGLKVRARRGYYAPSKKEPPAPRPDALDPRIRAAVDAPLEETGIPLRLAGHGFGPVGDGKSAVLVVAEVDLPSLALRQGSDKRWMGSLETYLSVSSRGTGATVAQEKKLDLALPDEVYADFRSTGLPVFRDLQLAPGAYQARFVARDPQSGRIGSVRHDFRVPDPATLSTSTPIFTDRLEPGAPSAARRPLPVAHRAFKTEGRLYYAFEVYGAGHDAAGALRLSSFYVVKKPDGSALTRMDPRPMQASPQGQVSQMLAVSLEGAAPGRYEMVLTVRDDVAGRSIEVSEPFDVEG